MRGKIRLKLKQYQQYPLVKIQLLSTKFEDGKDIFVVILDMIDNAINNYNGITAYRENDILNLPELNEEDEYGIAIHLLFETEAEVDKFILNYVNSKF